LYRQKASKQSPYRHAIHFNTTPAIKIKIKIKIKINKIEI
jgi:hypothetical protein